MSGVILRDYQAECLDAIRGASARGVRKQLAVLPTGCHRAGQGILMFDGSVRPVENIEVGDRLMGPDSEPRTVLRLARGEDEMVEVRPTKGEPWVVNLDHVLTLVRVNSRNANPARNGGRVFPSERGGELVDVTVREWLEWSAYRRHTHKLVRRAVSFPRRGAPPIDPWLMGVLLGDGGLSNPSRVLLTTVDQEVVDAARAAVAPLELRVTPLAHEPITYIIGGRTGRSDNPVMTALRGLDLLPVSCEQRFIPDAFKLGSARVRRNVLAGLIDADGARARAGFDFSSKSPHLAADVAFIARSLGLAAYVAPREMVTNLGAGVYHRVSISGDATIIPTRIARKRPPARRQIKDVRRTGFTVEPTGTTEPYFGFTLDRDGRYLLDDFTVTHNSGKTVVFSHLAEKAVDEGGRVLILAHRDELLTQARDKLVAIAPELEMSIGFVKAGRNDVHSPVVIASVQTLARQARLDQLPSNFDLTVVDEGHHAVADSYQRVIDKVTGLVLLVTATPKRADGKSLEEIADEMVFARSIEWMVEQGYLCPPRGKKISVDVDLSAVKKSHGDFQSEALADALEEADALTDVLASYMEHGEGRKSLIFCPTVAMAHHTAQVFRTAGFAAEAIDGTTPTEERAAILRRLHTGETMILANVGVLTEGFDEPSVSCIILAAPTKSRVKYTQIVGRGLRLYPGKTDCLILDVVGASEDNSIASLPALFGLKLLLDGEDVLSARRREDQEATDAARAARDEDEAEQRTAVNARDERRRRNAESIAFFNRERMNWTVIADKWTIPLGKEQTLVLWPQLDGEHFDVLLVDDADERCRFLARGLDLGYAQGAAEETIRKHGNRLLADAKAAWREDEVTKGQRGYLYKLGMGGEKPANKGEAADLITAAKMAKTLERVEAALVEREAVPELERVA